MTGQNGEEQLISANERLVWSIVTRFGGLGEKEELFQVGCIGLLQAGRKYDPGFNTRFSTYAVPYIWGEICRFLRKNTGKLRSETERSLAKRANTAKNTFYMLHARQPRLSELAGELSVTPEELAAAELRNISVRSLQEPFEGGGCPEDLLSDGEEMEEKALERESLGEALKRLSRQDACILRLRYGSGLSQTQTANLLGMTQVQVSRAEKRILAQLRRNLSDT